LSEDEKHRGGSGRGETESGRTYICATTYMCYHKRLDSQLRVLTPTKLFSHIDLVAHHLSIWSAIIVATV